MYYSTILKDSPIGFWKLDESSGTIAYDSSGCGNNGSYANGINKVSIPLVPGGAHTNKITNTQTVSLPVTKDFSGQTGVGGFGITKTEDNSFSLEIWFHPKNITDLTPILADENGIGIYWDKGNIVFKLESERVDYRVPYTNKSFHVVATYEPNFLKLYVDSNLVAYKYIDSFEFTNESLVVKIGPALSGEYFLIDAPAIYRYALNLNQVKTHYRHIYLNKSEQVVSSNFGQLFKSTLQHQLQPDDFVYPASIPFDIFVNDDIAYNQSQNSLYLTSSSGEFITSINLLHWKNYISSKIEWFGGEGISVYVSQDPDTEPWVECTNGSTIPGISLGESFTNTGLLYFKVQFESDDISIYIPQLYYLGIYLYENKKLYSHNGRSFISVSEPSVSCLWDVDFSNREYDLISRNYDNGIRAHDAGFYIQTLDNNRCVEMIITPQSLGSGYLFYNKTDGVEYSVSWASNGAITKSNISGLFINGQDISSATNISSYLNIDEPNYILIKTSNNITGQIWLNTKSENDVRSGSLPRNIYNLIAIYSNLSINHLTNYNFYIGNEIVLAEDSGIDITELEVKTYDFDWQVINNA